MDEEKTIIGSLALREKQPRVITIAAAEQPEDIKLRVAAYARVSSSSEDQLNSFAAQNRYYTTLISGKESWTMVDIYADEGITGTSAEKRKDFQRLMADCRRGKIDRILVKSISRFARNTKECLEAIRELKSLGVGVCFEKEHIDTSTMSGEMMTAMFAAFAQAESDSISGNMKWSYLRRMQNGSFIPPRLPYGYILKNNVIQIVQEQAEIVQRIFREYLTGKSTEQIAADLCKDNIRCNSGKIAWDSTAVRYILSNEKYTGNSLWQKYYTTDTLPHRCLLNHGEKDSYYAYDTHEAIIPDVDFERANALMRARAKKITPPRNEPLLFRRRLICNSCGSVYRRKVVRNTPYWACLGHEKKRHGISCEITPIAEKEIVCAFSRLYYRLKHYGIPILTQMLANLQTIRSRHMLWSMDVISLNKRISDLYSQNQMLATLKQQGLVDPDICISKTNELTEQLRGAKLEKERLLEAEGDETIARTQELLDVLETGPDFLAEFDAELFGELVDKIIVESNERIRFRLKNGLELAETIERTVR